MWCFLWRTIFATREFFQGHHFSFFLNIFWCSSASSCYLAKMTKPTLVQTPRKASDPFSSLTHLRTRRPHVEQEDTEVDKMTTLGTPLSLLSPCSHLRTRTFSRGTRPSLLVHPSQFGFVELLFKGSFLVRCPSALIRRRLSPSTRGYSPFAVIAQLSSWFKAAGKQCSFLLLRCL